MRKFTLFFVFLTVTALAMAQKPVVTKVWEHSINSTAVWEDGIPIVPGTVPEWMGNMLERGMAFYDGKLYIMSRKTNPPEIVVLDGLTGDKLSAIPVDTALVKGGTYAVNDIVVTPSGKILFCNLSTNSHTQAFKVYMMTEKAGGGYTTTNVLAWNSQDTIDGVVQPFMRLGDAFGFYGDVSEEGDGYILVGDANAAAPEPKVLRFDITAGVVSQEPVIITLKAVYPAPVGTAIPKLGITPRFWPMSADLFWADGHSVYPTLYNMQGELLSTFNGPQKFINPGVSGVAFFTFMGKDFLVGPTTSHNNGAATTAPKAAFQLFQIPAEGAEGADSVAVFPELGLGGNTNSSYASPIALDIQSDKVLMYIMSPYNGVACYALTMVGEVGNNTWNMSDPAFNALGSMVKDTVVNGLSIYAAEGKAMVVDGSNKTFEEWTFTHRIKFGGTGAYDTEGKPVNRVLSFDVEGSSKITIVLTSSNNDDVRTLNIAVNHKDSILGTMSAPAGSLAKESIEYHGGPATIYLSSASSGLNIYLIKVEPLATSLPEVLAPGREFKLYPNPARERVYINVDQPVEVGVFSITGSLMMTKRIESANDALDISGLTRGMYLVRSMKSNQFALKLIVQ